MLEFLLGVGIAWYVSWKVMKNRRGVAIGFLAWGAGAMAATAGMVLYGLFFHYAFGVRPGPALIPSITTLVAWGPLGGVFGIISARRGRSSPQEHPLNAARGPKRDA